MYALAVCTSDMYQISDVAEALQENLETIYKVSSRQHEIEILLLFRFSHICMFVCKVILEICRKVERKAEKKYMAEGFLCAKYILYI